MTELSYWQAAILGVLQGLTEFLPISSSGHLALAQNLMGLDPETESSILFDLALHLGTVVAVVAVFAGQFVAYFRRLTAESSPGFAGRRIAWKIALLGVAASIPTAGIGLLFRDDFKALFASQTFIAVALLVTGTLLWTTGKIPRPRRGWRRFGFGRALLIGTGQGLAIMPGISRSGTTIALAMLLGIKREWAGQFSFFIAMPAIVGASILEARGVMAATSVPLVELLNGPLILGVVAATVSGYVALRLLMAAVRRAKLHLFCYYCWLLGLVVLVLSH